MSSVHVARQGFVTKSTLPSVSRVRGITQVADNKTILLLNGNGTNGAQNNTFLSDNFGTGSQGNYSVFFDGNGDFLTVPSNTAFSQNAGNWTMETWVYLTASPDATYGTVLFGENTSGNCKLILNNTGVAAIDQSGVGLRVTGTTVLALNTWHHLAMVRNGSTLSLYVNGVSEGTPSTNTSFTASSQTIHIGRRPDIAYFLTGYISNLRFVKGTAVYTSNFTVPSSSLTSITNTSLLINPDSFIKDNSTNNFAITVNGDARVATNTSSSPIVITRNGNATQGSFSPFTLPDGQWSNSFDGSGDRLLFPSLASVLTTGEHTVEAWVNLKALPTGTNTVSIGGTFRWQTGNNNGWVLLINSSGNVRAAGSGGVFNASSTFLTTTNSIALNRWVHVAWTRDSSNVMRLFIDGVEGASATVTQSMNLTGGTSTGASLGLNIGTDGPYDGNYSAFITADISNFHISTGVGSCKYTSNFSVPTTSVSASTGTAIITCASNRFRDRSSNNHAATVAGDVRISSWSPFPLTGAYSPSVNGGSGYFDGTGDYLSSAASSAYAVGTGNFTVEFFVYCTGAGDSYAICDTRLNSSSTGGFWIANSTAASRGFRFGTSGAVILTVGGQLLNTWQHVAIVRNSGTLTIYVNGVSQGSTSDSRDYTDTSCVVGGFTLGASATYAGYISNFRFVKGTAVYTADFTPPTTPLTNITNTSLLLNFTNAGIFDAAGDNVIETTGNAQISTSVKQFGTGSLSFDGNGDALILPSTDVLGLGTLDLTVEFWFRLNTLSQGTRSIGNMFEMRTGGVTQNKITLMFNASPSNNIQFYFAGGVRLQTSTVAINTWYHLALTRAGGVWSMYLNGTSVGSTYTNAVDVGLTNILRIGQANAGDGNNDFFNGYIDDLKVTKGQARYTTNFTPPTAEAIVYGTAENIVTNSTYGVYQLA